MHTGNDLPAGHETLSAKAASDLVALIPIYHTALFRYSHGFSGMDVAQFKILHSLSLQGERPISSIGRRLCISKPYMTAIIDAMVQEGLVMRQPDPSDRRVVNVLITQKGKERLAGMKGILQEGIRNRLLALDDTELVRLCRSLAEMRAVLEKVPER
jgi:DNA-binding MarR family transcriptional regulator